MTSANPDQQRREPDSPDQQVRRLLVFARRKLLRVRAAESAAVCATAAAVAASAALGGWALAHLWTPAGMALCMVPAAGAAAILARPSLGRVAGLGGPAGRAAAVVCVLVGVLASGGLLLGAHLRVAPWLIPAAVIPAGAAIGALVSLAGAPGPRGSAIVLDSRARLLDRLATAAELVESPSADERVVRNVCVHALRAADRARATTLPLWSRGRATAAALALAVLLSVTLIPAASAAGRRQAATVASAARRMTAAEREQLAEAIRRAAAEAGLDEQAPDVEDAAAAADEQDAERLLEALMNLRRAGVDTSALMREDPAEDDPPTVAAEDADAADAAPTPGEGVVRVYSPGAARDTDDDTEPFEQAWSRARLRAAEALAAGRIPQRYRPLVRRYFEDEQGESSR